MFTAKQRFKNIWIWALMMLINMWMGYNLVMQLFFEVPMGDRPTSNLLLVVIFLVPFAMLILMKVMYLKVFITQEEVVIRYFPFVKTVIPMEKIKSITVQEYSALMDYGGWGIRYGMKGKAYIIDGNKGLNLNLTNGENILVGINSNCDLTSLNLNLPPVNFSDSR